MTYIPKIKNARLADDAVTSDKILDGEVATNDLALDAVTGDQIADDAVNSEHIATGAVGTDELAADAVTGDKIATGAVGADQIDTGAVGTDELAADAVTGDKLADDAVGSEHIAAGAVGNSELGADAVDGSKLADDAVGSEHIAAGAVGNSELASGAVDNSKVAADAAIELSKLATDPLDRANHTGTQTAATISDFDAQVQTNSLDEMAAPADDVDMNGYKLTGLAEPTLSDDAATKQYVDNMAMGLDVKASVRVATQANVDLANPDLNGNGDLEIDGLVLAEGDRVLVKEQDDPSQNGIYVAVFPGGFKALARAEDADSDAEVTAGMFTFVEDGTNGDEGWVLTTNNPIDLDNTSLSFSQFSSAVIVSTLDSLTDVQVDAVNSGSMLYFDGSQWRSSASDVSSSQVIIETGDIVADANIQLWNDLDNRTSGATHQNDRTEFTNANGVTSVKMESDGRLSLNSDNEITFNWNVDLKAGVRYSGNNGITSDHTIDALDGYFVYLVDTSVLGNPITITLPSDALNGQAYQIKDAGGSAETDAITIDGNGANIDGAASFVLDVNRQSVSLMFDGSNWHIL